MAFNKNYQTYRLPSDEEEQALIECDEYYRRRTMSAYLGCWKDCVSNVLVPKRVRNDTADNFYVGSLLRTGLDLLAKNFLVRVGFMLLGLF